MLTGKIHKEFIDELGNTVSVDIDIDQFEFIKDDSTIGLMTVLPKETEAIAIIDGYVMTMPYSIVRMKVTHPSGYVVMDGDLNSVLENQTDEFRNNFVVGMVSAFMESAKLYGGNK